MEPAVVRALSDVLGKHAKKSRDDLAIGNHAIDATVTLRVRGTVEVLEDESYVPTAEIPLKITLALFMHHAGITGEHAMNALVKAMQEAMEVDELSAKEKKAKLAAIREIADLDAAEKRVREGLAKLPEKKRHGKVSSDVEIAEVAVTSTQDEEDQPLAAE